MAVTTAEVEALFRARGLEVATEGEDERTRLDRITQQLNSGSRTMASLVQDLDYLAATQAESGGTFYDPTARLEFGGQGAAELQSRTGGNAQVWRETDTGMVYLVYYVPNTDVPLLYSADAQQVNALFQGAGEVTYDRELTSAEVAGLGGLKAGDASDPTQNPYEELLGQLERESEVRPWLRDPEVLAVITEAAIEGRAISDAELQQTDWWQSRTEGQRQWALLVESDPASAAQQLQAAELSTLQSLRSAGVNNASQELVAALARKITTGEWSVTKYNNQIRAISDPYSGIPVDGAIAPIVNRGVDTTQDRLLDVKDLAVNWLGPAYGQMTDEQARQWAGRLRNDPDAEDALVEMLQQQRLALFPGYENPSLTYNDIAGPWRNVFTQVWGQRPDETSGEFLEVVRLNDLAEAQRLLRQEGLNQGVEKVWSDMTSALGATGIGQQVRSL